MSTRAVYTFKDRDGEYSVYKHEDGYPKGAAIFIKNAGPYAWPLNRFESCEFAAAFIAANKTKRGSVFLSKGYEYHDDLSYRYEIEWDDNQLSLMIKAYCKTDTGWQIIFDGTFKDFEKMNPMIQFKWMRSND
jgi:hypothetical protein